MGTNKRESRKVAKDSFLSITTYREVKDQIKKKANSSNTTISKYIEKLVLADLQKDGVSITVKAEKKLI